MTKSVGKRLLGVLTLVALLAGLAMPAAARETDANTDAKNGADTVTLTGVVGTAEVAGQKVFLMETKQEKWVLRPATAEAEKLLLQGGTVTVTGAPGGELAGLRVLKVQKAAAVGANTKPTAALTTAPAPADTRSLAPANTTSLAQARPSQQVLTLHGEVGRAEVEGQKVMVMKADGKAWVLRPATAEVEKVLHQGGALTVAGTLEGEWAGLPVLVVLKAARAEQPAAGLSLAAEAGNAQVVLKWRWAKAQDAVGYYVYRGLQPGRFDAMPLFDFPVTGSTYTDTRVQNGTTYYYKVVAVGPDLTEGVASNEVAATPGGRVEIWLQIGNRTATVNGQPMDLDVPPLLVQERTVVPFRFIGEALGADIVWDGDERKIVMVLGQRELVLWIDRNHAVLGGRELALDVPPAIVDGRTVVPLRFVSTGLGADIVFDPADMSIIITYEERQRP